MKIKLNPKIKIGSFVYVQFDGFPTNKTVNPYGDTWGEFFMVTEIFGDSEIYLKSFYKEEMHRVLLHTNEIKYIQLFPFQTGDWVYRLLLDGTKDIFNITGIKTKLKIGGKRFGNTTGGTDYAERHFMLKHQDISYGIQQIKVTFEELINDFKAL